MLPKIKFNGLEIFQDGAVLEDMLEAARDPMIAGFTTNPTLMAQAGIKDYASFAKAAIAGIPHKSISFEVFSDDFASMAREARIIKSWGGNTYIKIPVMNTKGDSTLPLIRELSAEGMALNVTAVFTLDQVKAVSDALALDVPAIISVFAGRIADTGIDPVPLMTAAAAFLQDRPKQKLLWASSRELLNVFQADACGCHIITATPEIIKKLSLVGKDLTAFSRETVEVFYADAQKSGFALIGS